jgi:hypothetical protein
MTYAYFAHFRSTGANAGAPARRISSIIPYIIKHPVVEHAVAEEEPVVKEVPLVAEEVPLFSKTGGRPGGDHRLTGPRPVVPHGGV